MGIYNFLKKSYTLLKESSDFYDSPKICTTEDRTPDKYTSHFESKNIKTSTNNSNFRYVKMTSKCEHILFTCNGSIRKHLLDLADEKIFLAERWYQALYTVFSQASMFESTSTVFDTDSFSWLIKPVAFRSSAGILIFGIDQYADGGQYPICVDENEWMISMHIITKTPEPMCKVIVDAIEEVIKTKISWKYYRDSFLNLDLFDQQENTK